MIHNLSFSDHGKKTLAVDIVENVMDELRRERKTKMVLADAKIEELAGSISADEKLDQQFPKQSSPQRENRAAHKGKIGPKIGPRIGTQI